MIVFDANILGPWVAQRIGFRYTPGSMSAIGRVKDGQIVGAVLYENFNGTNVVCHIAGEGRWLNRRLLSIIFDYPFKQLKAKRITVVVAQSNAASRRLVEHLGFELEAILHDAHPDGDLRVYKMMADQCRWIKELPYEHAKPRNPRPAAARI